MMAKELKDKKGDIFYHKNVTHVTFQRGCFPYNVKELCIAKRIICWSKQVILLPRNQLFALKLLNIFFMCMAD